MRSLPIKVLAVSALGLFLTTNARAEDPAGSKAYFLTQLDQTEKKFLDLAEAIPADKYSWRPGAGVRSISEVLVHVSGGDVLMATRFFGVAQPANIKFSPTAEKDMTKKEDIMAYMKQTFGFLRDSVAKLTEEDLHKPVKLFGNVNTNGEGALMFISNHMHEHLGQMIAYSRTNGVRPPWTPAPAPAK